MTDSIDSFEGRWIRLKSRAIFRITGPDRVRFLNGQVTNDVSVDLTARAISACLCSLKGKVEALLWVSATKDALILDGELSQREMILARLDRYLIADDCEISDLSDKWSLIHHFVDDLAGVESTRLGKAGRDLWVEGEEEPSDLKEKSEISAGAFAGASIAAGVPRAGFEITGNEFPAELGLDRWAVDFHKGCYLGQEIVSRIESVGRVKRVLRVLETKNAGKQGEKIRNSHGEVGEITGPFEPISEEKSLGFGIFSVTKDSPEIVDFEPVEYVSEQRAQ